MKNKILSQIAQHGAVVIVFALVASIYFYPVFQNKMLYQPDIANFRGSAKEVIDYKKETGETSYWSNSMFSGMPTYFSYAPFEHNYTKIIDKVIRFLPRPADYVFLYLIGFYILLISLRVPIKLSVLGAIAFGFSTYFFIILEAGHNSKAHTIGLIPPVIGGLLMIFRGNYRWGFVITALFMALNLNGKHPQMSYYMFLLIGLFFIFQLLETIKNKNYIPFFKKSLLFVGAIILAVGMNAPRLLTAKEYSPYSIRGKSELTKIDSKNSTSGLDRSYITDWSYGISETLNLIIPNFKGGGSTEPASKKENLKKELRKMRNIPPAQAQYLLQALPTYWGDQPFTSGPAYQGVVVFLLFFLGIFLVKGWVKWWLVTGTVASILLAWGKNLGFLTDFFIDYFPFYNKFRAVASILIVAEFTVPFLGVLALKEFFFSDKTTTQQKQNILYKVGGGFLGFLVVLLLLSGSIFDFVASVDAQLPENIQNAIQQDRKDMLKSDLIRSILLVIVALGGLVLYSMKKINLNVSLLIVGGIILIDLVGVNQRYLNEDNFKNKREVEVPFKMTEIDNQILKDKSNYRVLNLSVSTMNDASTSYYHHSIGGYSGAKIRRYQEVFDEYISKGNQEVLNMLNAKYIISPENKKAPIVNPIANGNCWFVDSLVVVKNAYEEIQKLGEINTKTTALLDDDFKNNISLKFEKDSIKYDRKIELSEYMPNSLTYNFSSLKDEMVVFSEIYYPKGWTVKIDEKEVKDVRVNYILRALEVPKGKHKITFKFEPSSVSNGEKISLASSIVFILFLLGAVFFEFKKE